MRYAVALVALALCIACKPATLGGVRVRVRFVDDTSTGCVKVKATPVAGGASYFSNAAPRDGKDELEFGVAETEGLTGALRVEVLAWPNATCSGGEVAAAATAQQVTLERGVVAELVFEISGCSEARCPAPPDCFSGPACRDGGCAYELRVAGSGCDAGVCTSNGACTPGTACIPGDSCDDGRACTTGDRCVDAGVCAGALSCQAAPPCFRTLSSCGSDGGCALELDPRAVFQNCGGERVCLPTGECAPWFAYLPSNVRLTELPYPDGGWSFAALSDGGACVAAYDTTALALVNDPSVSWCGAVAPVPTLVSQDGGVELVVFTLSSLQVPAGVTARFVGSRPVALVVFGDATVDGLVALSSGFGRAGAGGDTAACGAGEIGKNRGGGGGGTFGSSGGNGDQPGAGSGGAPNGNVEAVPLRGGCSGAAGAGNPDAGGLAGGALQLSVAGRLLIDGALAAPGRGGLGGDAGAAGGGGASGGAIVLEARDLALLGAQLTANGGAGGEGSDQSASDVGANGEDGHLFDATPARSGHTSCCASQGGRGAAGATGAGNAAGSDGGTLPGGGGGGGGLGRVRINVARSCVRDGGVVSASTTFGAVICP